MALIQATLFSQSLMRTVNVNVILPVDKLAAPGQTPRQEKPLKTLYLLHGVFGSYVDWVSGTRIQRYAEAHDLAVVMPSGENAFYVDQPAGHNYYGAFIGQELVELTRRMFPLSRKREDTFIGGLSMGGYGAMRNGLKYSDTFGCITAFSGAWDIDQIAARAEDTGSMLTSRSYAEACFGDLDRLPGSDMDPWFLARQLKESGKPFPKIYIACGESDGLLPINDRLAAYLKELGAEVTYEVGPGAHEWDFWDTYVKRAIEWLPTEAACQGINSGNVGI
ncbi:MAG: alpha/beta hydrolase [Faecousia sp.]